MVTDAFDESQHTVYNGDPYSRSSFEARQGYRQRPVVNRQIVLPYNRVWGRNTSLSHGHLNPYNGSYYFYSGKDVPNSSLAYDLGQWSQEVGDARIHASNRAYGKLVEKIHQYRSELGTTLVEYQDAFDMIAKRGKTLQRMWKRVTGHKAKGKKPKGTSSTVARNRRRQVKTPGQLWLEYWMGWAPLFGDIYDSLLVVTSEIVANRAKAGASARFHHTFDNGWWRDEYTGSCHVTQGATVRCVNPNVDLLNRLGVVNPAVIAWNVKPFTFMVDWVTNVGNVLSSYSDFLGLEITDAFTSTLAKGTLSTESWNISESGWFQCSATYQAGRFQREVGLTRPVLSWSIPGRLSTTRAATAISLLLQLFRD